GYCLTKSRSRTSNHPPFFSSSGTFISLYWFFPSQLAMYPSSSVLTISELLNVLMIITTSANNRTIKNEKKQKFLISVFSIFFLLPAKFISQPSYCNDKLWIL